MGPSDTISLCWKITFYQMNTLRKAPFLLMFGKDPIVPLNLLLSPTVRYLKTNDNILSLEALKNMYQLIACNLEQT